MTKAKKLAFEISTRSGEQIAWLHPSDVDSVTALETRYGPRLICTLRDSGKEVWLVDTLAARHKLGLEDAA